MHDGGKIIAGLVVFLAIVTFPLWYASVKGAETEAPETSSTGESKQCVEPTPYMRSRHMELLDDWREEAVRDGARIYVGLGGIRYEKNLAATCIESCHSSRETSCDRCHEYVGVRPYCWDCHGEESEMH